ncbi:MAG: hypothetical protein HZC47_04460 [Methanobacterium sp.]|uniref:hypothetical protein n=1 Tax=Methanobacterium sp. TaxID=2164 RepID=UPI003D65D33B|nr:hypothetical protein [Methanobacterium sp.]
MNFGTIEINRFRCTKCGALENLSKIRRIFGAQTRSVCRLRFSMLKESLFPEPQNIWFCRRQNEILAAFDNHKKSLIFGG